MSITTKDVNCLIVDDEAVAREIIASHLAVFNNIHVVAKCNNALEAFSYINKNKVDLIFLDINMPEISGISMAKSVNKNIKIIFTTAYRDYAVEGFELRAVDYLLKPISFVRLKKAVSAYFEMYETFSSEKLEVENPSEFMFIRSDRKMLKIDFEAINIIESFGDYLKIHLETETIITRETITAIEAKLPQLQFMRIHRSFIIAISQITSFTNEHINISGKALPISRTYKKEVLGFLEKF